MAKVTTLIYNIIALICCAVCVNSSVVITFGVMSKLVQAIRYLKLPYQFELRSVLESSNGDIINFNIPERINRKIISKQIEPIFGQNSVDGRFLNNFWGMIIVLAGILGFWLLCIVISFFLEKIKRLKGSFICTGLQILSKTALSFLIIQLYGNLGDIIFFSALEMKSMTFKSSLSKLSVFLCIVFVLLGVLILVLHGRFLIRYRYTRKLSQDQSRLLESFVMKHDYLKVLHADFVDSALDKQGFAFILITIDMLVGLMVAVMVSHPLTESVLLVVSSILVCILLAWRRPYREKFDQFANLFLQLCVIIVFVCALLFAFICQKNASVKSHKEEKWHLAMGIISVVIIIKVSSALFMVVKLYGQIKSLHKSYSQRRRAKIQAVLSIFANHKNAKLPHHVLPHIERGSPHVNTGGLTPNIIQAGTPQNVKLLHSARSELLEFSSEKLDFGSETGLAARFNSLRSRNLEQSRRPSSDFRTSLNILPQELTPRAVRQARIMQRQNDINERRSMQDLSERNRDQTPKSGFIRTSRSNLAKEK